MTEAALVSDTCTLAGYVAAVQGLHAALRFRYRPTTIAERAGLLIKCHQQPKVDAAAFVAQKLVSWEWSEPDAPAPAISPDSLLALPAGLFRRLVLVVLGYEASDVDPRWPAELADELRHDQAEADAKHCAPGDVGHERREKN